MNRTARAGAAAQAAWTAPDAATRRLAEATVLAALTAAGTGAPVLLTPEEFDAWLADGDAPLVLDPNW
ncbi:hypothetical protein BX286_5563 [Streptomyces sp. 3211.6]|uniref:hypothetical protein n=1 Tax=Streptomyces TaxID=1883 RepID=UPI0009A492D6|nr:MULTISPECIES: hypothetical protein [Streptomyces]RKT07501.1 hypothetical protein BX286_5563 [Streptomyces sp. 3211.6]RPF44879.1 hypothetical protein EDD96_1422 [Streptomyces sp. Ag109_G2-6]